MPNRIGNRKLSRDQTGGLVRTEQLPLFNPRGGKKRNNLILQIFSGQKLSRNPQEILAFPINAIPSCCIRPQIPMAQSYFKSRLIIQSVLITAMSPFINVVENFYFSPTGTNSRPKRAIINKLNPLKWAAGFGLSIRLATCILNYSSIVLVVYCNGI